MLARWKTLFVAGTAVASACGSFGEGDVASTADGGAPTSDAAGEADGLAADAGPDASSCQLLVNDSFDDPVASAGRWRLAGTARFVDGEIELTPNVIESAGAMWMDVANPRKGVLRATFTSKIGPSNGAADGLAFVWSAVANPLLGGTASNYGVCGGGANGLAVVLETFAEDLRLVSVTNTCPDQPGAKTDVFGTHLVSVITEATSVTVNLSGKQFSFSAPRDITARAIGFTAATGGLSSRHAVDDVIVEICDE